MKNKSFCMSMVILAVLTICAGSVLPAYGNTGTNSISEGAPLPSFKMNMRFSPDMMQYLGLEAGPEFTLSQIHSKLVVIEVLSALCQECHKNAPRVNKLYDIILNDSELNSNVKLLGIAVGNDSKLVDAYRSTYKVRFPIVEDPKNDIDKRFGNVATPTLIIADSKGMVLFLHEGLIDDMDLILDVLRTFISQK